jgi:hypothetical protein
MIAALVALVTLTTLFALWLDSHRHTRATATPWHRTATRKRRPSPNFWRRDDLLILALGLTLIGLLILSGIE